MQKKDLIYYFLMIALICLCGYMIHLIRSETAQCVRNPFVYGASEMRDVECSCQAGNGLCPAKFFFNDTSFVPIKNVCGSETKTYDPIDFDNLNITVATP